LNLIARLSLRPTFDVAIPGLYAWVVTVGWPLLGENVTTVWAYTFGGIALFSLAICSWMVSSRFRLWSAVSVGTFVSASAVVWFLLGPEAPSLGLLGSVGYAAFAIGWVRASGTRDAGEGPTAYALDLPPRRAMSFRARSALFVGLFDAALPLVLAWRIEGKERALLGHAVALLGALQILSISSKLAAIGGQKTDSSGFPWAALGRTLLLAVVVAIGCWLTFS